MNAEFYIWKDAVDSSWFILGVKLSNGAYAAEASLFTDAIYDLFGREFHEAIKNVRPGAPVPVELTYTIKLLGQHDSARAMETSVPTRQVCQR